MHGKHSQETIPRVVIGCHRCGAEASIRSGKEYLCPRCAVANGSVSDPPPVVVCDLCERESVVRLGARFLCARCALAVLCLTADGVGELPTRSVEALEAFARGDYEPVLAYGLEIGRLAREGTMRLVDIAAIHHEALSRSMKRARDQQECVQRVEAGAVLFNVWAGSLDSQLEQLDGENAVLTSSKERLGRQVDELRRDKDNLLGTLGRAEAGRRKAVGRLIEAKEEERRRISLDLHDDAVQVLVELRMRLEAMRRREADAGRRTTLEELETTTRRCIGRLRRLIFELRSDLLERHGLAETLRQYLHRTAEQFGLAISLEDRLTHEPEAFARTNLYRIAQEAVANARKHARANRIEVALHERDAGILVTIRDDGIGFSPESVSPSGEHMGLEAMRERAESSGGWCRVESLPGLGTTVLFWVPGRVPQVAGPAPRAPGHPRVPLSGGPA